MWAAASCYQVHWSVPRVAPYGQRVHAGCVRILRFTLAGFVRTIGTTPLARNRNAKAIKAPQQCLVVGSQLLQLIPGISKIPLDHIQPVLQLSLHHLLCHRVGVLPFQRDPQVENLITMCSQLLIVMSLCWTQRRRSARCSRRHRRRCVT
jgi:hypothetical protein